MCKRSGYEPVVLDLFNGSLDQHIAIRDLRDNHVMLLHFNIHKGRTLFLHQRSDLLQSEI